MLKLIKSSGFVKKSLILFILGLLLVISLSQDFLASGLFSTCYLTHLLFFLQDDDIFKQRKKYRFSTIVFIMQLQKKLTLLLSHFIPFAVLCRVIVTLMVIFILLLFDLFSIQLLLVMLLAIGIVEILNKVIHKPQMIDHEC